MHGYVLLSISNYGIFFVGFASVVPCGEGPHWPIPKS